MWSTGVAYCNPTLLQSISYDMNGKIVLYWVILLSKTEAMSSWQWWWSTYNIKLIHCIISVGLHNIIILCFHMVCCYCYRQTALILWGNLYYTAVSSATISQPITKSIRSSLSFDQGGITPKKCNAHAEMYSLVSEATIMLSFYCLSKRDEKCKTDINL